MIIDPAGGALLARRSLREVVRNRPFGYGLQVFRVDPVLWQSVEFMDESKDIRMMTHPIDHPWNTNHDLVTRRRFPS